MMKRYVGRCVAAMVVLAFAQVGAADDVIFDFEDGVQGWYRFGTPTTDFGPTSQASVGSGAVFHSFDNSLGGWGMGDKSPPAGDETYGWDPTVYTGFSVDAKLTVGTPPTANTDLELMLRLPGYLEWASFHTLTDVYQTFSADFADLVPQASATAPITSAQLADPVLEIRLIMRRGSDTGKGVLRYDEVTLIPEPGSLALLGLGAMVLAKRRR